MPLNNLSNFTHQRSPSNQNIPAQISNLPEDTIRALVSNIANATIAASPPSLSTVEKNLQDLQKRFSPKDENLGICIKNNFQVPLGEQNLSLRIKAPEVSSDLPIFFMKNTTDTIDLSLYLPSMLQKPGCATILDLLKKEFPKLTSSFFDKKVPRFVFSSPIPLNHEDKGNFFPQIESEGQIAYIAWDSSGSRIAKGFKGKTCDILLENKEAFCGASLSQANLKGIEKGAGVSAHFMTSKITVIGILITKPTSKQEWWWSGGRTACDSAAGFNDLCCADSNDLIASRGGRTTFGMLGVQGASVSSIKENLPDRLKRDGEKLIPFCLEIVPQFSSEENPVKQDDLEMAIEMQFQEKVFARFK